MKPIAARAGRILGLAAKLTSRFLGTLNAAS
jgi:hypothetical protein